MTYANEAALTRAIVRALERDAATDWEPRWVWKVHGGQYGTTGVPDLLVVARGRAVFLEVKHQKPGESREHAHARVTLQQRKALVELRAAGAWADVVLSVEEARDAVRQASAGQARPPGGWHYDTDAALKRAAT